jgi:hypothetical protein
MLYSLKNEKIVSLPFLSLMIAVEEGESGLNTAIEIKSKSNKRLRRFLFIHGIVLLSIPFFIFVYKCPVHYFLHILCPGCVITRAYVALLSLDWRAAFGYHPLFFVVLPILLYVPHRGILRKRLEDKTETLIFIITIILFISIYILRPFTGNILYTV